MKLLVQTTTILFFIKITNGGSFNCGSIKQENNCVCQVKHDELTSMTIMEARCQYMQLQEFPTINSKETISSFDLSHNDFEDLETPESFTSHEGNPVISLNFCHNSITDVDVYFFDAFPNLIDLNLSHNYLQSLEPKELFYKLEKLQILDLSYNEIEVIPIGAFGKLNNLKRLDLSYNNLHQVLEDPALITKLRINKNLIHLGLDNVGLTKIHTKCWNHFENLKHLSVADNPIDEVPQTSLSLEYLDISGTNITNIHENNLKYSQLKTLKMSRIENLTSINPYAFFNLMNLEEFVLTDSSKLQEFSASAFGGLHKHAFPRKFRRFELARNRLNELNESYKYIFQEMEEADVSFNPWTCDCDVLWMKEMDAIMLRKYDIRCSSPSDLTNKMVVDLEPKDLPNCHPGIYGKKSHQTALLILLLIVFALIVVIVYLCLYSPSWSIKMGSSKISPDSPYSISNE